MADTGQRRSLFLIRIEMIVWIGQEISESGTETAQFMLSLDSVIYADESREEDGHMNYMASAAQLPQRRGF